VEKTGKKLHLAIKKNIPKMENDWTESGGVQQFILGSRAWKDIGFDTLKTWGITKKKRQKNNGEVWK